MSSKIRFFRSGIMLTAVALAMRTVSLFFGAFVSRTVGAEGVGIYTLVMTVYSFAVTFATSGISLTVTRLVASKIGEGREDEVGAVLKGAIAYALFFGLLGNFILFFGAELIGIGILSDRRTVEAIRLLSFSLAPVALGSVFSGYFVGVKRVGFNAFVQVVAQLAKIMITVATVTVKVKEGVGSAVVGLCVSITVTEILAFGIIFLEFIYERSKSGVKSNGGMEISGVLKMAVPLALSAYVRSVLLNIEHILIPKKLRQRGESETEAYSHYGILHGMALPLILYPMSPLSSFSGLLVPEFAEDMSAGRNRRMENIATRAMTLTLSYSVICASFIFLFAEELGYAIYDSFDAGFYISTLALVIPIMYLDHVADSMLKGIGEQVFSMWVNISDSLISVALVWFLIPQMGIMGYALVIVIMEGYNFLLSVMRLRKKIKFKIRIEEGIIRPFCASVLSCIATRKLFSFDGKGVSGIWLALKILFALAITVFLMIVLKNVGQRAETAFLKKKREKNGNKNKAAY